MYVFARTYGKKKGKVEEEEEEEEEEGKGKGGEAVYTRARTGYRETIAIALSRR